LIPCGDWEFPLPHHAQTSSGAHPVSCPMGSGGSLFRGKEARE